MDTGGSGVWCGAGTCAGSDNDNISEEEEEGSAVDAWSADDDIPEKESDSLGTIGSTCSGDVDGAEAAAATKRRCHFKSLARSARL